MPTYGRRSLSSTGVAIQVTADGSPEWTTGGITIDWATITAEASDRTLADGTIIKAGAKGLEFGTVLCEIATAEVQTATITGSPTGGTFTLTGNGNTTAGIAYNAAAAAVQTAVRGLGGAYAQAVVTGSAGGPYTITFPFASGDVAALTASGAGLTGGSSPAVGIATSTAGAASGYYGPFSSAATDGRQSLVRGRCCVLNESLTQNGPLGLATQATDHPGTIQGGRVWRARLKVAVVNPTSIGGNAPSVSEFETAFPRISYADL
jgi:hypothetical protein